MTNILLYPVVTTASAKQAVSLLHKYGISTITHPAPEITHLMLDVPSFTPEGSLRCGEDLEVILERIPPDVTVIGGNLTHPALAAHCKLDLLKDETYLAENHLYFCSKNPESGELHFSKTLAEHEAAVAIYAPLWEAYDASRGIE